ncbi:hypothetical protein PCANC_25937 [Puccinia coronata f. sp. avenae]|uniref:Uncharacterized protein n=1 Tax=Puccinia coronata f. sp. avenae TaxID=200324 RepID=A0A2N5TK55_9BASI|nr:hypothetical protein PCANC_25937 [Puccinia coronata f. sp. avenae]
MSHQNRSTASLLSYSDPFQARQTTKLALPTNFSHNLRSDPFVPSSSFTVTALGCRSNRSQWNFLLLLYVHHWSQDLADPKHTAMQNNQPYPSGTGNSSWCPPTGTTWPTLTDDGPPPLAPCPTQMSLSDGRPSVGGTNYPMGQAQYGHETQPNQLSPTSEVRRPPHSSAAASLGPIRTHSAV